jgi:hypothetical protein
MRRVPVVDVRWVTGGPRPLVQVIMSVGDKEEDMRNGVGSTLAQAFEELAKDIRWHAHQKDDDRMRAILGGE